MKQVQDPYFRKSGRECFAAISVYKLEEIDRKRRPLNPGMRVLDLGAASGSRLQNAAGRVGPGGRCAPAVSPVPWAARVEWDWAMCLLND